MAAGPGFMPHFRQRAHNGCVDRRRFCEIVNPPAVGIATNCRYLVGGLKDQKVALGNRFLIFQEVDFVTGCAKVRCTIRNGARKFRALRAGMRAQGFPGKS